MEYVTQAYLAMLIGFCRMLSNGQNSVIRQLGLTYSRILRATHSWLDKNREVDEDDKGA
jgi:hypothetical protein